MCMTTHRTRDGRSISTGDTHPVPRVREAHDADHHPILLDDPSDEDARLDIALDESFPTSDAPGHSRPGTSDPAPSSGYDHKAETGILLRRKRKTAVRSAAKIGIPLAIAGALIAIVGVWMVAETDDIPPYD
jgi:hypothetical protein